MTPNIYSLESPEGIREIVAALLMGYNYRLYTEGQTRSQLLDAYQRLIAVREELPSDAGHDEWLAAMEETLERSEASLAWWLLGLDEQDRPKLGR